MNFTVSSNKLEDQAKAILLAIGRKHLRKNDMLHLLMDKLRVEGRVDERKVVFKGDHLCNDEGQLTFAKTVVMAAVKSMSKVNAERVIQMTSNQERVKSMFSMMNHICRDVASEMAQVVISATESHANENIKIIGEVAQQRIDSGPEDAIDVVRDSLESLSSKMTLFDLSEYKTLEEKLAKFLNCEMKDFQAREVTLALRCYDITMRMRAQAHDQQIDLGAKPESPVEKLH